MVQQMQYYLSRFSELAGDNINCGPILNWLEVTHSVPFHLEKNTLFLLCILTFFLLWFLDFFFLNVLSLFMTLN